MPPPKAFNRIAPRVPPVKYFSTLFGTALMIGTEPGPHGDDLGRKWTMLNKAGRVVPAQDMAARYFLFGDAGCEQIGAHSAANLAAELGGLLEILITGETWRQPARSKPSVRVETKAASRKPALRPRASR
ncbi:MAG: hypothetical protein ABIU29_08220, partial [Chthoniobacterales bacterium]